MSTSKLQQLTTWFGQLGSYLPSFDLFDFDLEIDFGPIPGTSTPQSIEDQTRQLEEAVARREREEKQKREAEQAEARTAERNKIITAAHENLKAVPALPEPAQTGLLAARIVDDAAKRIGAAEEAYKRLVAAKDLADPEFEKAAKAANDAIGSATTAAEDLKQAVAAEATRRTKVLNDLKQAAAKTQGGVQPDAKPPLVPENQKCLKNLNLRIGETAVQLEGLDKTAATSTPEEFERDCGTAQKTIEATQQLVEAVNNVAASNRKKDEQNREKAAQQQRTREIEDLRWMNELPSPGQLAVLADDTPAKALTQAKRQYDTAYKTLQSAPVAGYEAAKTIATDAYAALDRAYQDATKGIATEIAAREERLKEFRTQAAVADGTQAGPEPLSGTDEATELQVAKQTYRGLYGQLANAKSAATQANFNKLASQVAEAVKALLDIRKKAAAATTQRLDEVTKRKAELTAAANTARTKLPVGPTPEIVKAAREALDRRLAADTDLIDGKNPIADTKVVQEFVAHCASVEALGRHLARVPAGQFAIVAANVVIVETIDKLLVPLNGKEGIGPTAVNLASTLEGDVAKVAGRYAEIADLRQSYDDIIGHAEFDRAWKPEIDIFLPLESGKKDLNKQKLAELINASNKAFDTVEERIDGRERAKVTNATYNASPEGQFIQFMLTQPRNATIAEMERLVATHIASRGVIYRAYMASHDSEADQEFSVEIRVDIGGQHGVVVHAHCKDDGTPKGGNACHFKRANNKRGSGGTFMLSNALRGALLPGAGNIIAARRGVWEGRRPSYV